MRGFPLAGGNSTCMTRCLNLPSDSFVSSNSIVRRIFPFLAASFPPRVSRREFLARANNASRVHSESHANTERHFDLPECSRLRNFAFAFGTTGFRAAILEEFRRKDAPSAELAARRATRSGEKPCDAAPIYSPTQREAALRSAGLPFPAARSLPFPRRPAVQ